MTGGDTQLHPRHNVHCIIRRKGYILVKKKNKTQFFLELLQQRAVAVKAEKLVFSSGLGWVPHLVALHRCFLRIMLRKKPGARYLASLGLDFSIVKE